MAGRTTARLCISSQSQVCEESVGEFSDKSLVTVVESSQRSYLDQFNINLKVSSSSGCGPRPVYQTLFILFVMIGIPGKIVWCWFTVTIQDRDTLPATIVNILKISSDTSFQILKLVKFKISIIKQILS